MHNYKRLIVLLVTITVFAATGCASMRNFGKFVPDDNAKTAFETFQVNPEYRYFITGSDTYPVAILALNKSYTMGNNLWKELVMPPDSLSETVTNMQMRLSQYCSQNQSGFSVLAPDGKQIGILYSYIGVGIFFEVDEKGTVILYGPRDDDQLKQYQGRTKSRS